jgi:Leucine-rich repeat (LRR) protein
VYLDNDEEPKNEDLEMLRRKVFRPLEEGMVSLPKLRLGVNSAISLAKGLKKSELNYIDLSNNMIGDIGCVAIMQLAQMINTITYLNIESNDIGDEGCVSIGRMLANNRVIHTALFGSSLGALHGNLIGSAGTLEILKGLENSTSITRLGLNKNNVFAGSRDQEVAEAISKFLTKNSSLKILELGGTQMTTRAAVTLFNAVANNKTLSEIDVSYNTLLTFPAFEALSHTLQNPITGLVYVFL